MKLFSAALVVTVIALPHQSAAQDSPRPKLSGRDMYVSCYLYSRDSGADVSGGASANFSAVDCGMVSLFAIAHLEGAKRSGQAVDLKFCLPKTGLSAMDPAKAMSFAYLEQFEKKANVLANIDGTAAFIASIHRAFPCPATP